MRFALALFISAFATFAANEPTFYLPAGVRPVKYRLELRIDPSKTTFDGRANIDVDVSSTTDTIWLNGHDLEIRSAAVDGNRAEVGTVRNEFVALHVAAPIEAGRHNLHLVYTANLSDEPYGAYRRRIGSDAYVFTTFTPIGARRAFPCFDEPRFKAVWEVILTAPPRAVALFNARAMHEARDQAGWRTFRFAPTRALPSEVVAFAVGPFDIVDAGVAGRNRIPVRVITPAGQKARAAAAASATAALVSRLEEYTGIPYPWDKLDHLAGIQIHYGAVENPGLILYESRLLLAERSAPAGYKRMRGVMAHELAHQWFGNLVTQAAWDDVWLSEGMSQWLGMKTVEVDEPLERRETTRVLAKHIMMNRDRAGGRPVRRPLLDVDAMQDAYNRTVYVKGAAVMGMLEQWLGDEALRRSLNRYLTRHPFGNATTNDLAEAIRAETGTDVTAVLQTFLNRSETPDVELDWQNGSEDCLTARVVNGSRATVPVCVILNGVRHCIIATDRPATLSKECPAWMFADAGGAGYYRAVPFARGKIPLASLTPAERMDLLLRAAPLFP